jgi:hypothetical protein
LPQLAASRASQQCNLYFAGQTSFMRAKNRQTGVDEPTGWLGWLGSSSQTSFYKWLFEMCGELAMADLILVRLRDRGNGFIQP